MVPKGAPAWAERPDGSSEAVQLKERAVYQPSEVMPSGRDHYRFRLPPNGRGFASLLVEASKVMRA
jgi:hypothetical protein